MARYRGDHTEVSLTTAVGAVVVRMPVDPPRAVGASVTHGALPSASPAHARADGSVAAERAGRGDVRVVQFQALRLRDLTR